MPRREESTPGLGDEQECSEKCHPRSTFVRSSDDQPRQIVLADSVMIRAEKRPFCKYLTIRMPYVTLKGFFFFFNSSSSERQNAKV